MTHEAHVPVQTSAQPTAPPRPGHCALVIFGITGDLSQRKLIPALYRLHCEGALPERFSVVGISRSARDADALRARLHEALHKFSKVPVDETQWAEFAARIDCVAGSASDPQAFVDLRDRLAEHDEKHGLGGNRLFYLAVAPKLFSSILTNLRSAGMILPVEGEGPWTRVIVEKPFGHDLESARELNRLVAEVLDERQTYRIDHYLGKETVQNLLVFRFANAIFEPLWNRQHIESVQITAGESILVTNRGAFYDQTGVVRDIVQNHLLQILALTAMEPPISLRADDVRDQKVQAIRSLRPVGPEGVVFGQYEGYLDVEGVAADSRTPTFVAVEAYLDTWRWHGVPFFLRAGKGLSARDTEVAITFRQVPSILFGDRVPSPNQLVLQIQPNDGISLQFVSKVPGDLTLGSVNMDMTYAETFGKPSGDAYQRLLLDGMRGDATLFARRDEVEEAWRWVDPFLSSWAASNEPIRTYAVGDPVGPAADMVERHGLEWRPLGS
jgi:glucose-6-phosphate 1-dehydrogenase